MAELLRPETFEFFARYLLAGFIVLSVRSRLSASRSPRASEVLFDAVILSLINQAVFLATLAFASMIPVLSSLFNSTATTVGGWLFFVEILVFPIGLGILFGRFAGSSAIGRIIRRLSMPGTHPISEAYDFVFSGGKQKGFVILTYNDGTVIYGYFGDLSFAASDDKRSDIFLEALYVAEGEQWKLATPPRGAWIRLDGIRSIEFLGDGGSEDGAQSSD